MNNVLSYLGGFIALVLAALFAVPQFIDWNGYRGVFEEEAGKILGREVRVGGSVNLRLLPTPYVSFEKVRIANIDGRTGEPLLRIDSFTMRLAVPPLLRGAIVANEIELVKPMLSLSVDRNGEGNWGSFEISRKNLPFIPADVALHSVKISDGSLVLHGSQTSEMARADKIDGELSADALDGPYKFRGTASHAGSVRDVKFATTKAEADGTILFKASADVLDSGNTYTIDGKLSNATTRPKFEGQLSGILPVGAKRERKAFLDASREGAAWIELKARFSGGATALSLDDITASLENAGGEPQIVNGSAALDWTDRPSAKLSLVSKWLDFDRVIGPQTGVPPTETARRFADALYKFLPPNAKAELSIAFDQVKIGGDAVGSLRFMAERSEGPLRLKEFEAGLPGGARLWVAGNVTETPKSFGFDGTVLLRGTTLARFVRWIHIPAVAADFTANGPFFIEGKLLIDEKSIALTDARSEIDGVALRGDIRIIDAARPRFEVSVEGDAIDTSRVLPATVAGFRTRIERAASGVAGPDPAASKAAAEDGATPSGWTLNDIDILARLAANQLQIGTERLSNVDAKIELTADRFVIPDARFTTPDGLDVSVSGAIDQGAKTGGAITYETRGTGRALSKALNRLGAEVFVRDRLDNVASTAIAGRWVLGGRSATSSDLSFDGAIGSSRVSGAVRLDGGFDGWRDQQVALKLDIQSPDELELLSILTGRQKLAAASAPAAAIQPVPGQLRIDVSGTGQAPLLAVASLKTSKLNAAYDGTVTMRPDKDITADGTLNVAADDLRDLLSVANFDAPKAAAAVAVDGKAVVAIWKTGKIAKLDRMKVGATTLSGTIALQQADQAAAAADPETTGETAADLTLSADLKGDVASIPSLLSSVLNASPANVEPATMIGVGSALVNPEAGGAKKSLWPDAAFDFSATKGVKGQLGMRFDKLILDRGLTVNDAKVSVSFSPDHVDVSKLEGLAAGGELSLTGRLDRVPAGADAAIKLNVKAAELASVLPGARGRADFELDASGRAQSLLALMSVAKGKGRITLKDADVAAPNAASVSAMADAVLAGRVPADTRAITETITNDLAKSRAMIGEHALDVTVADGTAAISALPLTSDEGDASLLVTVDLAALSVDAAWQLMPRTSMGAGENGAARVKLPPVSIVYVTTLGDVAARQVIVDVADFQRELAVRKLEVSVNELERLRRIDEQRAARERERELQRELERERQKQLEEAQPSGATGPPIPPPPITPPPNTPPEESPAAPEQAVDNGANAPEQPVPADGAAIPEQAAKPISRIPRSRPPSPPSRTKSTGDYILKQLGGQVQ